MRKKDETRIDWQIASAKAALCLRWFKSEYDPKWLDLAERHLSTANSLLEDMDRRWVNIADPVKHLGADRDRVLVLD